MGILDIIFIIYALLLPIICKYMGYLYDKNPNCLPKNTMGYLKYDYYTILFLHILAVIAIIDCLLTMNLEVGDNKKAIILICLFDLLIEYYFFYLVSWKIVLKDESFVVYRFLRRKKEYKYCETKILITRRLKTILYDSYGKKILSIPQMVQDDNRLSKMICKCNNNPFLSRKIR